MGKHGSDYVRPDKDFFPTPAWVVEALAQHVNLKGKRIWECACGTGEMAEALLSCGATVYATDVVDRGDKKQAGSLDFLADSIAPVQEFDGIVTNPPFGPRGKLGEAFIESGLRRIKDAGFLCLLLPSDFDAASTRARLFGDCPQFVAKITLRKRIKWFDRPVPCRPCGGTGKIDGATCLSCKGKGEKMVGPKENHCWMVWQSNLVSQRRAPLIMYSPVDAWRAA